MGKKNHGKKDKKNKKNKKNKAKIEDLDLDVGALEKERDELLKKYPELRNMQEEIDWQLKITENFSGPMAPYQRARASFELMMDNIREKFLPALKDLEKIQQLLKKLEKDLKDK